MQQNVARSLGYSHLRQSSPQGIRCGCSTEIVPQYVLFDTDNIGRTCEVCPTGRCWRGKRPLDANVARARDLAESRRRETAAILERATAGRHAAKKRYSPRSCELPSCGREFAPRAGNQRFCSSHCCDLDRLERS
jgi:hypothetical protein